jgi:hypothetical protein
MQVFCERFLRFMAGEQIDLLDPAICSCSGLAQPVPPVGEVGTGVEDSRLEPFRPHLRITPS